jgi:hypothetical protein
VNDDILNVLSRMLGLLDQLSEERGVPKQNAAVDKNIIKSENSPLDAKKKESTSLSGGEKKRLTETFTLFNKLFFDYQRKQTADTAGKTLVSKISTDQKKAETPPPVPKGESGGSSLMSMILGGLALLAASIGGIIASISGFFGGGALGDVITVIGKVGMIGALKILAKTFLKKFALGVLKKLPIIGGIISLTQAVMEFTSGNFFKGIGYLLSGLLNFVPIAGPWLSMGADLLIAFAESKGMFDEGGALSPENGWNTIKGWMSDIGKVIMDNALYLPIIGGFKRFGMAYDSFKSGNIGEGLKQTALGLITFIGGGGIIKGFEVLAGWLNSPKENEGEFNQDNSWMSRLRDWIKKKLKDLPSWLAAPLRWFGILDDEKDDSGKVSEGGSKDASKGIVGYVTGVWDNIKGPMGDAVSAIGDFTKDAWKKTTQFASDTWDTVMEEAPKVWNSVKDFSSKAWDKAKEAGSWFVDSMKSMADKTKEMINAWIPGIVDTISGIADSAMKVLKGIADKIGGWIANLFGPDDEKKLKESKEVSKQQTTSQADNKYYETLVSDSSMQIRGLTRLVEASTQHTKLLVDMVNIGSNSLRELKRISGTGGGGSNSVTVVQPPQPSPKQMVTIPNNRDGFASSAYAIG